MTKSLEYINSVRSVLTGKKQSRYTREQISDISVALFLNSQFIIRILQAFFPVFDKVGVKIIFLLSAMIMVVSFCRINANKVQILIPLVILLYTFFTGLLLPGKSAVKLIEILNYVMVPFVLVCTNFRFDKVVKYTLIMTAPAVIVIDKVFVHYIDSSREVIEMVLCHAVLYSIVTAISYIFYYSHFDSKKVKIFYYVLCAVNGYYFYELLLYGGRSATLSIVLFIACIVFFRPDYENGRIKLSNTKILVITVVTLILGGIVLIFGKSILAFLYETLSKHDINIRFIQKTYKMLESGDVSNGRTDIYRNAIQGFLHSPLIGNGLDMFEANTGYSFPHNLFFQFMYDGGFIMIGFIIVPVIVCSVALIRKNDYGLFLPWLMLFCVTIPVLMFSGDIWIKYTFWFFVAYSLAEGKPYKVIFSNMTG